MNGVGVKLQIERLAGGVKLADGFFQRVAGRIADVLGRADQRVGEAAIFYVGLTIRCAESVEVSQADAFELPIAALVCGKAARLMSLGVTADVHVEADVLGHSRFALVTAHMILADVCGGVAVFLHGFRDGDRFCCDIFALFGAEKCCVLLADPTSAVAVQTSHDVDIIVDARRVLPAEHGGPSWCAVRLSIRMRETQPFIRQLCQVRRHILFVVRPHCRLFHANVIPTQIIDHVDDNVGLLGGTCSDGEHQNQKWDRGFHREPVSCRLV